MRMTNKIMQNNSLYNINNNKIAQDKLSTMMATQKKITKPSDDPVIAIRALRLRTSVSEMTQFYEKNAPDAESWLDVTAQSLKTVNDVLTSMGKLANKANNKDLGSEDLQVILEQLKSLRSEFYSTGNVDYAGRYIFTGFRTDTTLTFREDVEQEPDGYPDYAITEPKTILDFDSINYTYIDKLGGLNKNNYEDGKYDAINENQVENGDIHRLRLAYDVLDKDTVPEITYVKATEVKKADGTDSTLSGKTAATVNAGKIELDSGDTLVDDGKDAFATLAAGTKVKIVNDDGSKTDLTLDEEVTVQLTGNGNEVESPEGTKYELQNGTKLTLTGETEASIEGLADLADPTKEVPAIKPASVTDKPDDPYEQIRKANEEGKEEALVLFVPETGEILFSNAAYDALSANITEDTKLNVTYHKKSWLDGDLRPEHYFECTKTALTEAGDEEQIHYNKRRDPNDQKIEYDVGYNQKIQVNTMASEVFGHGLDRDIDDLERALNKLADMDATRKDLDTILKGMSEDDQGDNEHRSYNEVRLQYEAADKAYNYMRENVHNMFGSAITKMQNYLNDTNEAVTDNGTRSQRLDLISNRLMEQRSNFQTLKSENEDIDIAEVVIQLTSTELTYNAALMATGKIMQTSLMNYI
ncbi:MAG: hypothetical protein NC400_00230 [Clostridium sp.]|nr:hypothetical protein [Clostridium sp.]